MSNSKNFRWVLVANLVIRNEKNVPPHVPLFTFDEVEDILRNKFLANDTTYTYLNDTKMMKIRDISPAGRGANLTLLISIGDKAAPVPEYENYATGAVRDVDVDPDEGFSLASHIVIKRQPDDLSYTMMIEKMSGINLSSISAFLRHLFNDPNTMKTYTHENIQKTYRPLFEVTGHQSLTLRDAITNGTLEDIELVSFHNMDAGTDEHNFIQERVRKAKYIIGRRVTTDTANSLFTQLKNVCGTEDYQKMFVRVKTNSGQTRMTEIGDLNADILSQLFCHNEIINDFTAPIESVHKTINNEIVEKIIEKMP